MARCVFIVQGEGRGHMSQAMALKEYLEEAGHSVEAVMVGGEFSRALPEYFKDCFPGKTSTFQSPFFLTTPDRKGIYVGRTLIFNMIRSLGYLREVGRMRNMINSMQPDVVFNFYDVLGALALRKVRPSIKRIGIGHHFYLHLNRYPCPGGAGWHRWLLGWHTRLIMRSCDQVLALSFSEQKGDSVIDVVPPLIRREFRELKYQPGNRFLVYFLTEGYIYDLIMLARKDPEFNADIFTSIHPGIEVPASIRIHPLSEDKFRNLMASCRGIISTAGFDTAAEAAYSGIPLAVVPAYNHFEQKCNGVDIDRNGVGTVMERLDPGILYQLKHSDQTEYRKWVERSSELILKHI